ncbi:RNA-directed DNA polymerase, eukaryota, reverse transcriptase zinc-binding domain protein [Tanacetum coccineum]
MMPIMLRLAFPPWRGVTLANRLSKVIKSIISPEQSAFITGRQILDGPLILSETIDWHKKRKKKMMLFKVDFEKAFDFVRQGDPLSHFLFIIVMEGLHMALNDGLAANMFHGVKIMASYTGCEVGFFPFTYLGLPIGSNVSRIANWQPLIDQFKDKLWGWKANLHFIGGRLTLIKYVLGRLGNCYLSIFKVPETVVKSLKSLRASFFWGSSEDYKKLAWVKWSNILASLDKGGLGVSSHKAFNMPFLLKWRWRLFYNFNVLWVHVVKAIHGDEACIDIRGCHTNKVWGSIVGSNFQLHLNGIVPLNSIHFKVSDGSSIYFWKDTCRPVNVARTKAEFDALISDIANFELGGLVDSDTCIWSLSHDDKFSVNSVRMHIDGSFSLPYLQVLDGIRLSLERFATFLWNQVPTLSSLVTQLLLFDISFVFGQVLYSLPFPHVASGIFGSSHGMPQRKRRTAFTPSLLLPFGPYDGLEIISLSTLIL